MGCLIWALNCLLMFYALLNGAAYHLTGNSDFFWQGLFAAVAILLISLPGLRIIWLLISIIMIVAFLVSTDPGFIMSYNPL